LTLAHTMGRPELLSEQLQRGDGREVTQRANYRVFVCGLSRVTRLTSGFGKMGTYWWSSQRALLKSCSLQTHFCGPSLVGARGFARRWPQPAAPDVAHD
jgi:hypothetical protein